MKCFHYKDADSRSALEALEGCAKNSTWNLENLQSNLITTELFF